MTIRIKVEHMQPGYDKCVTVIERAVDVNGNLVDRGHPTYTHTIKPGKSDEWFYVHSAQALEVREGPDLADVPADPTPTN